MEKRILKITILTLLTLLALNPRLVNAELIYSIENEFVFVQIFTDGKIRVFYSLNISITGDPQKGIYLRMPDTNITNYSAIDGEGKPLIAELEKEPYPRLKILWNETQGITNTKITVNATAFVNTNMFYNDTKTNPGNVAMKFKPAWFEDVKTNTTLTIKIVLPEGANSTNTKFFPEASIIDGITEENLGQLDSIQFAEPRSEVVWSITNWPTKNAFECYVSLPAACMDLYLPLPPEGKTDWLFVWIIFWTIFSILGIPEILDMIRRWRRQRRERERRPARIRERVVEERVERRPARIREDLTTAEAAVVVNLNRSQVMSIIIFTMVRKNCLEVIQYEPEIKVRKISSSNLESYEKEVYEAVKEDGSFDKDKLIAFYDRFKRSVENKMRGYDIEATRNYYKNYIEGCLNLVEASEIFLEMEVNENPRQ